MAKFAKYEKGRSGNQTTILKDGHTMFSEDVVRELNRKSYLEGELAKILKKKALSPKTKTGHDIINTYNGQSHQDMQNFTTLEKMIDEALAESRKIGADWGIRK